MWVVIILVIHFLGKLKWKLEVSDCTPPPTPPEDPLSPQSLMTHHFSLEPSYLLHTLDSHQHGFSRAAQDSWNVIPACCPGTVVHSGKNLPVVFRPIGSLCWGRGKICKGFGGMWPSCPHLLPLLPNGGSCLFSEHTISCPRIKIWLYSQVLFSQKLPREATWKTPAQARYSFLANSCYKEAWVQPEWIMLSCWTQPNLNLKQNLTRLPIEPVEKEKRRCRRGNRAWFLTYTLLHWTFYNKYMI